MRPSGPAALLIAGVLSFSLTGAGAETECSDAPYPIDESKLTAGPAHHPIGRSLPDRPDFNQPTGCDGALRFFDDNANGRADPGEVRLFGTKRQVDCGSCHGESAGPLNAEAASVYLRQNASRLCLTCHRI